MATEELNIIAIELGSSKVIGVAGIKRLDGKIEIKAHVQQDATPFMRKGVINNADLATTCIKGIKAKLEEELQKKITQVYVSYSGQGIHSVHNEVKRRFDEEEHKILKEDIDSLDNENTNITYEGQSILDVVPQEYAVGTQKLLDAVGVMGNNIEGRYLNIIAKSKLRNFIENCFQNVSGVGVVEYRLTPLVMADQLLNEAQKNSGCLLVDIGADTTTVSIYKSKLLRFLSVIPLGSENITKDIMTLQMEHDEAEELKVSKFGEPYASFSEEEGEAIVKTTSDGIEIRRKTLSAVIDARLTEILVNVKQQINESKYARDSLIAGAFLTGGGAGMTNITNVFKEVVGIDKVTIRKNSQSANYILPPGIKNSETRYIAALGLIAGANQNCTADFEAVKTDIFEPEERQETTDVAVETGDEVTEDSRKPKKAGFWKRCVKGYTEGVKKITEE